MPRQRCVEPKCTVSAQGKTGRCKRHGGGKRCIEPGCAVSAIDKTDKCARHGGGNRCVEPGCTSGAEGKTDRCITHGGGKRCIESGCAASAQGKTLRCARHGGGVRCAEPGCAVSAIGKTGRCIKHGGGKRCVEPGCAVSAKGKTDRCITHGGGVRCPNCIDWPDSRSGSTRYDGYCATCFKRTFPTDSRSTVIYAHTKEIMVRNSINKHFDGFVHDTPMYTGGCDCTHRRRIDHRLLIGNTILAVETDEFGHRGYDSYDEEIRYDDVYMIHSGKWVFIRFNPDSNISEVDIYDKLRHLIDVMHQCIEKIHRGENHELVEIIKLYC